MHKGELVPSFRVVANFHCSVISRVVLALQWLVTVPFSEAI